MTMTNAILTFCGARAVPPVRRAGGVLLVVVGVAAARTVNASDPFGVTVARFLLVAGQATTPSDGRARETAKAIQGLAARASVVANDLHHGPEPTEGEGRPAADEAEHVPGLVATYRDGNHSVRTVTPRPDIYLGPNDSLHPALSRGATAEWSGLLTIVEAGLYTFHFDRDRATLFIRDRAILDMPTHLDTGRHPIRIVYAPKARPTRMRLRWSSEGFPTEPLPDEAFSHLADDADLLVHTRVERGRDRVEEYGCINCHTTTSRSLEGRLGPDLSAVGSRTTPSWVAQWLKDPRRFRAGSVMPAMLDEAQRRDVAAYLETRGRSAD